MALPGGGEETHFPKPNARTHTDLPCVVVLLGCVLAMVGIVGYAWRKGDTRRLTHGFDYRGRLCGVDAEVAEAKYLYYCGVQGAWDGDFPRKLSFRSKTCLSSCPEDGSQMVPCLMHEFHNFTELPGVVQYNVTFISTLSLEITQSVTLQRSYPTKVYRNRYCVPQWRDNNTLLQDVITGPLARVSRLSRAVGSFRRAWPVVLAAAVLAVLLGLAYLHMLRAFAGPLIFISLCVGTALLFLLGLFFLLGIFMNPWDEEGQYQRINLFFRSFYGVEAKVYSVIAGFFFCAAGVCMAFTTMNSTEKIDESVGVIQAACDCMFAPGPGKFDLLAQPIVEGLALLAFILLSFLGFMLACSVGYVDETGITINNEDVKSLERRFVYHSWWKPLLVVYALSAFFILEYIIALGHFVVSYAVCLWYFVEIQEVDAMEDATKPFQDAYSGNLKRLDKVRVHGVDNVEGGERPGYIERGPAGKVLVVPIGKRGPNGLDFIANADRVEKKEMQCGATLQGLVAGVWYHAGSLALGSIIVTSTRPFRWISHTIKALLGRADERGTIDEDDRSAAGIITAGFGILSGLLDSLFGGYSKNAYADMVLSSSNFFQAANDSLDFIAEAGGVVAFLHGGTALYEMIGVVCITTLCGGAAFLLLTLVPCFHEPGSHWYVNDPWMMTVLASGIACMISFGFMSLFNVTADTLLYVFAWSRRHHSSDIEKYCPHALKELVGEEMNDEPEHVQLQARSRNKLTRFHRAAARYAGTVMTTMRGQGPEQRPLLPPAGGFQP